MLGGYDDSYDNAVGDLSGWEEYLIKAFPGKGVGRLLFLSFCATDISKPKKAWMGER